MTNFVNSCVSRGRKRIDVDNSLAIFIDDICAANAFGLLLGRSGHNLQASLRRKLSSRIEVSLTKQAFTSSTLQARV